MKTGLTYSATHECLSSIAVLTGSTAIIGLAVAFVTTDFGDMLRAPALSAEANNDIAALEPIRSDAKSEHETKDDIDDLIDKPGSDNDDNSGLNGFVTTQESDNPNTDHDEPCLDPDCDIHNNGSTGSNERPPIDISMENVSFLPDSDEYLDKNAAIAVLEKYVDVFDAYFDTYPDGKIYLVGCIAKTSNWYLTDTELSEKRAEAVRDSFVELGVDADRLIAIGVGVSDPWREDEWANGYFDEDKAKINRRVWVIPDEFENQVRIIVSINEMLDDARN